jgi:hypothetical protein
MGAAFVGMTALLRLLFFFLSICAFAALCRTVPSNDNSKFFTVERNEIMYLLIGWGLSIRVCVCELRAIHCAAGASDHRRANESDVLVIGSTSSLRIRFSELCFLCSKSHMQGHFASRRWSLIYYHPVLEAVIKQFLCR